MAHNRLLALLEALGGGGGQEQPGRRRRPRGDRAAVRAGKQGRGRGHRLPRGGAVVENAAGDAADLGHDRGLLSGGGPLRRREGTRHLGDAAEQPGRAQRDRPGQTAHRHGLQHRHGGAEPGEHGHGGVVSSGPVGGVRPAAAAGPAVAGGRAGADFRPLQRVVPGPGRPGPQHPRRPILPRPPALGDHAAGRAADGPRRRTHAGQQPDPGHRRGAVAAGDDRRVVLAGAEVSAGGAGRDPDRLRAGGPLGGRSVQLRDGLVPRERAAGRGALAAPPVARPPAHACGRRGRLLRHPHFDAAILPRRVCRTAARFQDVRPPGDRRGSGGGRLPCRVDGDHVDRQSAANAAVAASPLVGAGGEPVAGRGPAPGRQRLADGGPTALSHRPRECKAPCKAWSGS